MSHPGDLRPLSNTERELASWMLVHGLPEARNYLPQVERASATDWRCPCGCASFALRIQDLPDPPPGVHILGDFMFGQEHEAAGAFIYSSGGILAGVEVYGLAGDAPKSLPKPQDLRPLDGGTTLTTSGAAGRPSDAVSDDA